MSIGKKLKFLRERKKLRQYEVAELLGVSQKSICTLEGRDDIQISTLKRYIESLGGEVKIYADFNEEGLMFDLSRTFKE